MIKIILTLSLILGFVTVAFCDEPPPFNPGAPTSIPVDGGSLLLLGAATGYGIKRLKENKTDVEKA